MRDPSALRPIAVALATVAGAPGSSIADRRSFDRVLKRSSCVALTASIGQEPDLAVRHAAAGHGPATVFVGFPPDCTGWAVRRFGPAAAPRNPTLTGRVLRSFLPAVLFGVECWL